MRKIIQLTGSTHLVALCDDGSSWMLSSQWDAEKDKACYRWNQLPTIPQDETIEKIKEILS